ncbi:MAG: hypothetical protein CMF31_05340 [Kordiimonas sp.]|nr:hypothetical protein [Kordiimonas sp.]
MLSHFLRKPYRHWVMGLLLWFMGNMSGALAADNRVLPHDREHMRASSPQGAAIRDGVVRSHGVTILGQLKYPPDFRHFDYVNPQAPKGGTLRLSEQGSYDSLHPFILKGVSANGLGQLVYETLTVAADDEPSAQYGLIAETIEYPRDKSWVIFTLRPEARWHDGQPITPEDVIFSFNTLMKEGSPRYRFYYQNVVKVEALDARRVKFSFDQAGNNELPYIVGSLPILPQHYWQDKDFTATTLVPPLGSGPYKVSAINPGRTVTFQRVEDYWGQALAVNRGKYNFDTIQFEYFRDDTARFEAFKAGAYDLIWENSSKRWATEYVFPAAKDGRVITERIAHKSPVGMQAFGYNLRRQKFADPRVRRALAYCFDFEWTQKNIFYGQYSRTKSYFDNSELAATGLPKGAELALLTPYRDQLPAEVFSTAYDVPYFEPGWVSRRANLLTAKRLLEEAGWYVRDGVLTHLETGQQMEIEFLLGSYNASFQRLIQPMIRHMEKLGIRAHIAVVDISVYQNRMLDHDFDIYIFNQLQSTSPGNEQREMWGSEAADRSGSRNFLGIKNPVIDALIDKIIFAPDRSSLVTAVNALDRVLLWGHYVIPQYHSADSRIGRWQHIARPAVIPPYLPNTASIRWLRDTGWDQRIVAGGKQP